MAHNTKTNNEKGKNYLFDFSAFIDDLRGNEAKKNIVEEYEKKVLKGKKITGNVEDQLWYKDYLSTFSPVPNYKVPEEMEDDFDWDFLFRLVAGSYSNDDYCLEYDDSVPDLAVQAFSGKTPIKKKISELWSFQIVRLFEIYCEEQIVAETAMAEEDDEEVKKERRKLHRKFKRKIKPPVPQKKEQTPLASTNDSNYDPDHVVYYYCSLESAYHILKSGKMFASDLRYMNDKEELTFGIDVMMEALRTIVEDKSSTYDSDLKKWLKEEFLNDPNEEKFKQELAEDKIYIACFSKHSDDLSQWRAYGDNGKGVCIKFDFNVTLDDKLSDDFYMQPVKYLDKDKIKKDPRGNREDRRKKYWTEELKYFEDTFKSIKENYQKTGDFVITDKLRRYLRYYKNSAFEKEEEFRLLYLDNNGKYETKIRVSKGYLTPYVELELGNEKKETSVVEITIGPAVDFNKAKKSFESFFEVLKKDPGCKYDYSNVKIVKSPIPYLP